MAAFTLSPEEFATLRTALDVIKTASRNAVDALHLPDYWTMTFTIPELVVIGTLVEACVAQYDERNKSDPAFNDLMDLIDGRREARPGEVIDDQV